MTGGTDRTPARYPSPGMSLRRRRLGSRHERAQRAHGGRATAREPDVDGVRGRSPRGNMTVKVRVPTTLRTLTGGKAEVEVDGSTVGEVINALDSAHPGFSDRLLDEH